MAPSKRPARRLPPTTPVDDDEDDTPTPDINDVVKAAAEAEDDDDEDEDEAPARSKAVTTSDGDETEIKGGWTEGDKQMASTSSYAQTLKLEEKAQVIKFLDDTPYANFRRHWVERTNKEGKSIRAYGCPKTVGKECPLCDAGDRPQAVAAFNIAIVGDDDNLILKSWDVGPRLFAVLKGYANDPKIGPLTKGFFIASRTGKRGTTQHNVAPVSRTALEEDYDITPPTKESLDKLAKDKYTPKIVEIAKVKDLRELAEEMADEYE